jgi:hypothetical protein
MPKTVGVSEKQPAEMVEKKVKPIMYLEDSDADYVGPVSVGDTVKLTVTAKVLRQAESTREDDGGGTKSHKSIDLEIQELTRDTNSFAAKAQRAGKGAKG